MVARQEIDVMDERALGLLKTGERDRAGVHTTKTNETRHGGLAKSTT